MKKVLIFTVLIVLLFAENAAAACNITLHVQVPTGGNVWSAFYVQFGANTADRYPAGAVADTETWAGWYVVDLSTINLDTPNQSFLLARSETTTNSSIGRDNFNSSTTALITCPNDGGDYYLAEDPSNPGRTYFGTTPPAVLAAAKTFYLLPPNTRDWIEGIPYIMDANGNRKPMGIDPTRCGWYKAEYQSGEPVPERMMIGIGPTMQTPINGGIFNLAEKFAEVSSPVGSRNLFFVSETSEWSAVDPMINETERCSYSFAAIIYDTDRDVNCSFNPHNSTTNWSSAGFKKGVVQPTLDANRKLQFNGSAATERCPQSNESGNTECKYPSSNVAPSNCIAGWNEQNFNMAWNAADTTNVVRCYDMPFQRSPAGLWEFNSNKLCANGNYMDLNGNCSAYGGYLGGFFPNELQTRGDADYSNCETCDKKYSATGWQALANNVSSWCYERAWGGTGTGTGDLSRAQTADEINAVMQAAGCTGELNGSTANIYNSTQNGRPGNRNFFFCFESHAEFTYEPGQEFFFSGDDDVWIFINNRLALDLGGVHPAVPGYVKLDTIKTPERLVEGNRYPIDIFFCERNLVQSNIRIATNMYFAQQSGLFWQAAEAGKELCLQEAANTCAALSGTASKEPICGAELAQQISYSLVVPGTGNVQLNSTASGCVWDTPTQGVCYGGIVLNNGVVSINEDAIPDYLKALSFEIYASVPNYSSLNVSRAEPGQTFIATNRHRVIQSKEPLYYSLKGEPLGKQKPKKAGVYIVRQNGVGKTVVVK